MNNNGGINLTFDNNFVWQSYGMSQYYIAPKEIIVTRRVPILSTDSEEMVAFKRYMNQFPEYLRRTEGKPNKKLTACPICDITSSPEWRSGPNGKKLCNACGLQFANFKKEMLEQQQQAQERVREKMSLSYILN